MNINQKNNGAVWVYEAPVCEILIVGPQDMICDSGTEHVGETEGEW